MAVKVPACGSVIQIDFGDGGGFTVMGLADSITMPPRNKGVNESPDLECTVSASVGTEEVSQSDFQQYWDLQDTDHAKVDLNFEESKTDLAKRDVTVQHVTPTYTTDAPSSTPSTVTEEYPAQVIGYTPEALTPQGYYKRTVRLLRTGPITRTTA
ncbi:MAG: hypothetical protein AAGJ83_08755 [Planctomycetota bacterium]